MQVAVAAVEASTAVAALLVAPGLEVSRRQ